MKRFLSTVCIAAMTCFGAVAAEAPKSVDQVAQPGGKLPGDPKIALVKVAGGFKDPINVTNAGDGTGRMFVVERIGAASRS